jgi:hypothetical protein
VSNYPDRSGSLNHRWKGGLIRRGDGYMFRKCWGHPRCSASGYVLEHVLVVEGAMRRYLRPGAAVHHVNETPDDNRNQNLVVCQDNTYHMLLHQRKRALEACGNAGWLKCSICKQYDDPANMRVSGIPTRANYHLLCQREWFRLRRERHRETYGRKKRPTGWHHSPETRAKMSAAHKGRPKTLESRRKSSETKKRNHLLRKEAAALLARTAP